VGLDVLWAIRHGDAFTRFDPNLYTSGYVWPAIVDLKLAVAAEADHPFHEVPLAHSTLSPQGQHQRRNASHDAHSSKNQGHPLHSPRW